MDLNVLLVDQLQKTKKEYKYFKNKETQDIFIKTD